MPVLQDWEDKFRETLQRIDESKRQKAGVLLPILPDHAKWDEFLALVKIEWQSWSSDLDLYPSCLIVLYDGLAFYEYDRASCKTPRDLGPPVRGISRARRIMPGWTCHRGFSARRIRRASASAFGLLLDLRALLSPGGLQ